MQTSTTQIEASEQNLLYRLINGNREVITDASYYFDNRSRMQGRESPFWVLQYTIRGQAFFDEGDGRRTVNEGEAMLFRYGENSRYGYEAKGKQPYWHKFIGFSGGDVDAVCGWIRQRFGSVLSLGAHSAEDRLLDRLLTALTSSERNRFAESALLYRLLMEILARTPRLEGKLDRVIQAHDLMEDRFREPITISTIADEVGWSREHLTREYRQRFGTALGSVLRERRLHEAQRLLSVSDDSIEAIALRCGYVDLSTFIRAFRVRFGEAPGTRRHRMRGNGKAI